IAEGALARALAIADKLDTLAGLFAIGQKPSGSKDPFSLRRSALGLARTLIEAGLDLDLVALIEDAIDHAKRAAIAVAKTPGTIATTPCPPWQRSLDRDCIELYDFILDRLRGYYQDQGIGAELFESVAVLKPLSLADLDQRLRAVQAFGRRPEAASLAAANKRIGNLLRQAGEKGLALGAEIDPGAVDAGAESDFQQALAAAEREVAPLIAGRDYLAVLNRLAALRDPVDAFFEGVMVMAEDPAKRQNRLNGLNRLRRLFTQVADISLLP
ncbi:MAG: glycine--tRNA ligase subunit beta, partial [Lysobacterales bacterium]